MLKICTVVGARPQFIKASAISREIDRRKMQGEQITEILIHTGQHFDKNMSDVFFNEMAITKPQYNLSIQEKSHATMTGKMLSALESVLITEKPDYLLVYGDTNSTLAGALAAAKLDIKVAHVEAGLRSYNLTMPEEQNRILTDRISAFLFCPTEIAKQNLQREGIDEWRPKPRYIVTGDVMLDSALHYKKLSRKPLLNKLPKEDFILCTIHRAENTNHPERLKAIFSALRTISKSIPVILPLHPRTAQVIQHNNIDLSGLIIIEPVGYLEMLWLLEHSKIIMTDSGGLQKDAYFFKKPCLTLRDETEWLELIDSGCNQLVGCNYERIIHTYENINFNTAFNKNLYGTGSASTKIIASLLNS